MRILDIYDPPKRLHIFGGLNNKRIRRCSRGSNGISTRDSISFGKGEGEDEGRCDTGGFSFFWRRPTDVYDFTLFLHLILFTYAFMRRTNPLATSSFHSSPISGKRRRKISSTISTTRCLLMNESANKSNESSTSLRMIATSPVAKYLARTYGGTTSTMTRAHSRLMARTSSSEGGTRAGPSASSGKMARRMACKAGGSRAGFNTRAWRV